MKINEIKNRDFYKLSKTKDMKNNPIFKNHIDYHYIEYIPDKLTVAEDEEMGLYFTSGKTLLGFIVYGNQLTIINFDENNENYQLIMNNDCEYQGTNLDQYKTQAVITKRNISLANPESIKILIKLSDKSTLDTCVDCKDAENNIVPGVSVHLKRLGYLESLHYWEEFVIEYEKVHYSIENVNFDELDKKCHFIDTSYIK